MAVNLAAATKAAHSMGRWASQNFTQLFEGDEQLTELSRGWLGAFSSRSKSRPVGKKGRQTLNHIRPITLGPLHILEDGVHGRITPQHRFQTRGQRIRPRNRGSRENPFTCWCLIGSSKGYSGPRFRRA